MTIHDKTIIAIEVLLEKYKKDLEIKRNNKYWPTPSITDTTKMIRKLTKDLDKLPIDYIEE